MPEFQPQPTDEPQSQADRLVQEIVKSYQTRDLKNLDQSILKLGAELGVELETAHEKALQVSQAAFDELFAGTEYQGFNFKQEYIRGNIALFTKEQEREAKKELYTFQMIFPAKIPRNEFLEIVSQKYTQKFDSSEGKGIWFSDNARADLNQTIAAKEATPTQSYLLALRPQNETTQAHPDTVNLDLSQQKDHLQELQTQHPSLNLQGLNLPEYLFADFCFFQQTGKHLDQEGFSYLLKEQNPQSGRALRAIGLPVSRRVWVEAFSGADSGDGARFAAVSQV